MLTVDILKTMRPHQWVKNLFVVAPIVFAERLGEPQQLGLMGLALGIFCILSGCVYILNDAIDVEADREHPVKKKRPMAAGRISTRQAWISLGFLLVVSIGLACFVSWPFAVVGASYFLLNVAYSLRLKHIPFLDVTCISVGFVLRIYGGALAINVPLSPWLIACTFLLATFLGLGKRKHELLSSDGDGTKQRRVLAHYRTHHLTFAMALMAGATFASYTAYVFLSTVQGKLFDPFDLVWTLPSVAFGIWRFNRLTERQEDKKSPTDLMLYDMPFMTNMAIWAILIVSIIYLK
jgi:decaprenyl-phosphate phosphoribosyltransferase